MEIFIKKSNSRKETLQNYEQKYLEKFDKVKNEIQKMKKKQQDLDVKELKERIARRLKLEKESGKQYKKLISKKLKPKSEIESEIESKIKHVKEENDVIEAKTQFWQMPNQQFKNPQFKCTRDFIRKRRIIRELLKTQEILLINVNIKKKRNVMKLNQKLIEKEKD